MRRSFAIGIVIRLFATSLLIFMVSCSRLPMKDNCLPPLTPIGYPSGSIVTTMPPTGNLVPKNWIPMLSPEQVQALQIGYVNSMVVRSNNEIWFVVNGQKGLQLVRYLVQSKAISTYKVELSSGESYVPGKVFLSRTDEIWGINPVHITPGLNSQNYLLSEYDATTDKFLPFASSDGIQLDGWKIEDVDSDDNGNLWIVVYGSHDGVARNSLMKVDVQQKRVIHIDALDAFDIISLAIDDQEQVWLFARTNENSDVVLQYDPSASKLKDYGTPPIEEVSGDTRKIFADHNNHLWISNRAWLDTSNDNKIVWYITILPAAFVAPSYDPFGGITYQWWYDTPMIEDREGRLWFGYPTVTILNTELGEWCQVHRENGVIAQDKEGNVWIFSGSQLYKYLR